MSRVLPRLARPTFLLESRTLATFAAHAGVLLSAKHGSVLLENTTIGGDESARTGQGWLTFSSLGQQTLGDGVRGVGDWGCVGGHHLSIGEVFLRHILPLCHTAWGGFKLSYEQGHQGKLELPSGFMTCFRFGILFGSPWSSTSSSPGRRS